MHKAFSMILFAISLFTLTSCAGSRHQVIDEFTGEKRNSVRLESIEVLNHHSSFASIGSSLSEVFSKNGDRSYLLSFASSAEGMGKGSCPKIKKDSQVIFLIDGKRNDFKTTRDGSINYPSYGTFLPACMETNIDVGPLSKDFLNSMAQGTEVKFQIYGQNGEISGKFNEAEKEEIAKFLKDSEPSK